jgi:outer membrane lipoprotein-sorting protein
LPPGWRRYRVVAELQKNWKLRMKCGWRRLILLTVSAAACGCGHAVKQSTQVPVTARPVAQDATEAELLERYNAFAQSVNSINATMELKATAGSKYSGVIDEYHEVKVFLLASRPYNVRMIGQVPVVGKTVFDMSSDAQKFEVSIPSKNKFLVGPVALERQSSKPIENLRPQHLLDAVLWPEVRKEEVVLFEESNDENALYYVLTVLRGGYQTEILRKIWFDRADLRVARLESYGPKGALLSDARYRNWQPVAAGSAMEYPMQIQIDRPHDEYQLEMTISKIALNETLTAGQFKLEPPAGAEIVHVGESPEAKQP